MRTRRVMASKTIFLKNQEQMMRIATDLAGYTLPEADTLRKAIGKKIKTLLDAQGEKMMKGISDRNPFTYRSLLLNQGCYN